MAQTARPIADSLLASVEWSPTPNYVQIDESVADDGGTYIVGPGNPGHDPSSSVQLGSVTDPGVSTGHTMRVKLAYNNIPVDTGTFYFGVLLYQGDPYGGGYTYIAQMDPGTYGGNLIRNGPGEISGSIGYTTFTYTLTGAEANAITNYSDLWIYITVALGFGGDVDPNLWCRVSWFELEVPSSVAGYYSLPEPFGGTYTYSPTLPDPITFDFDLFWENILYPAGYPFVWTLSSDPGDKGWWWDLDQFNGAAKLAVSSRPKNPRAFTEIVAFATGSAAVFGGFPVGTFENKLIYAPGGYTVGTDLPTLRIFDGSSDHEIATLPKTAAAAIPKAVMNILVANGTVYLTTLDSGSTSADFAGRVFRLDVESGNLVPVGAAFTGGQLPYVLAWHNGRLWVGTNTSDPTVHGKVYFFRPNVDTAWTLDTTLGDGGVCSLVSYKGLLYVGCSGSAATFAKILVRGVDTTYSVSNTGAGGTARTNNAFLALQQFGENLYASYWNPDTSKLSRIWKFDNATWTSVYSEATHSIAKPWQAFPNDGDTLLAIAGGVGYAASLITTTNGTSWSDNSAFLTQSGTVSTGLPAWGMVVR